MPSGDPTLNGTAEYAFDANNPGVCSIRVRLTVNAPGILDIANSVRVCIDQVGVGAGASQLTWMYTAAIASPWVGGPGQPPGADPNMGKAVYDPVMDWYEVSAVFTNLPDTNDAFGPKTIYAQIVSGGAVVFEVEQPIEIFHDRIALNNPGAGTNMGPNWYYYWKNPVGIPGRVITGSQHDWQYEFNPFAYGFYILGEDHVNVCDVAADMNSGPEVYFKDDGVTSVTVAGQGRGPLCCAEIVAHETLHKVITEVWGPLIANSIVNGNDIEPWDDPDDDGVPNMWETVSPFPVLCPTLITLINDPDTFNLDAVFGPGVYDTYGDAEVRCRAVELDVRVSVYGLPMGGLNVDRTIDWTSPGRNTVPPTPPAYTPVAPLPVWWPVIGPPPAVWP
jgi:hypothetical protein